MATKMSVNRKIYLLLPLIIMASFLFVGYISAEAMYGIDVTADAAGLQDETPLSTRLGQVVGGVLSFVGILFFGLMIYGGITWMTSRGNQEQEKKAITTITAAVIGIFVVLGSYALISLVFKSIG